MGNHVIEFTEVCKISGKFNKIRLNETNVVEAGRVGQLPAMGNVFWHEVDANELRIRVKCCHMDKAQALSTAEIKVTKVFYCGLIPFQNGNPSQSRGGGLSIKPIGIARLGKVAVLPIHRHSRIPLTCLNA